MCWNASISFSSFIAGSLVCLCVWQLESYQPIRLLTLLWMFVLFMQVVEGFIWLDQDCTGVNQIATRVGTALNIMQPVVAYALFMSFKLDGISDKQKLAATALVIFYMCFMLTSLYGASLPTCIRPSENCRHLNLHVWKISYSGIVYVITLLSLILLLVRPLSLSLFVTACVAATFLISQWLYGCGQASMWCWLVVFLPAVFMLFHKATA